MKYDFAAIEKKWQDKWEQEKPYAAVTGDKRPKFYGLIEFPYPSAAGLHVGHPRPFTAMDIICRKRRMQGYNVLFPIGFDAFGLPTENYALKNHINPEIVTAQNVARFKSQLKALCERLLGRDNFTGIDLKEIEARFGTSSIYGMRLAGSSDMRYMTVSELNAFKLLTGGDCVFAEFKGEQQFKYTYCGLLWFCMNKLPHFGGDTGAWVYDRIMIVHCDNVIENSRQDKMLLEKMYAEREGIVYKCIAALMDVIRNGYRYSEPKCVLDARNTYMEDNSTVITFFHECMVPRKHKDNCTTGKLYDVYRAWCVDNNNGYAETARALRDKLCEYLGKEYKELTVHTEIGTCYRDYTLSLDAKRQYVRVYGYDSVS